MATTKKEWDELKVKENRGKLEARVCPKLYDKPCKALYQESKGLLCPAVPYDKTKVLQSKCVFKS